MSTYEPQIDQSGQRPRWFDVGYDKHTTVDSEDEVVPVSHNFSGALQPSETISSVAYEDNGSVTSGHALNDPTISFMIQKTGHTKVTVTGSLGSVIVRRWFVEHAGRRGLRHDYLERW